MADLTEILAENQKQKLELITPVSAQNQRYPQLRQL